MEFFGVEVPAGNPTTCSPGDGMYLHVSQAALGDSNTKTGKVPERVVVKVSVEPTNEIVLGTLSEGKCDQMHLDLVFDRDFTISHNSKFSSVYICGYRTEAPEELDDEEDELEDEDEEEEEETLIPAAVPIEVTAVTAVKPSKAGKTEDAAKSLAKETDKAAGTMANAIAKAIEKTNAKKPLVDGDDSEEDESDEDEGLGLPFLSDLGSDSDDDEFDAGDDMDEDTDEEEDDDDDEDDDSESDESEEEELTTPEVKAGKKRPAAEPLKTADKKVKTDASPKTVSAANGTKGKKAAQVTPVGKEPEPKTPTDKGQKPAKAPKGTPAAPPPTPVSGRKIGEHKCSSCDRTFTTESALNQHSAAKHS